MAVSKKDLEIYEFNSMFDYYNHIYNSLVNGQNIQANNLINKLSKEQKKDAIQYFDIVRETEFDKKASSLILESI